MFNTHMMYSTCDVVTLSVINFVCIMHVQGGITSNSKNVNGTGNVEYIPPNYRSSLILTIMEFFRVPHISWVGYKVFVSPVKHIGSKKKMVGSM